MGPDSRMGAAVTEELCEHDMVPAYCALCRPRPVGVLARGFEHEAATPSTMTSLRLSSRLTTRRA